MKTTSSSRAHFINDLENYMYIMHFLAAPSNEPYWYALCSQDSASLRAYNLIYPILFCLGKMGKKTTLFYIPRYYD